MHAQLARTGAVACALLGFAGSCSSSGSDKPAPTTTVANTTTSGPTTTTTSTPPTRPKAALAFHEVMGTFAATGPPCTLTSTSSASQAILFDRARKSCYLVGPVRLDSAGIDQASVVYDSMTAHWAVELHWRNNDFVTKIARPLVGREVAIVVNGVVQSVPQIPPGVVGRAAQINDEFTRAQAVQLAASIMGVIPAQVPVGPKVD